MGLRAPSERQELIPVVKRENWMQTVRVKKAPTQVWYDKAWRQGEIEKVK